MRVSGGVEVGRDGRMGSSYRIHSRELLRGEGTVVRSC